MRNIFIVLTLAFLTNIAMPSALPAEKTQEEKIKDNIRNRFGGRI